MRRPWRALLVLALAVGTPRVAAGEAALVARTYLRGGEPAGSVFFMAAHGEPGAVAVGSAHSFDRTQLAESGEVEFRLPADGAVVARSSRYYAAPGRAFHESGATLRDDYVLFSLAEAPRGVRLLEAAGRPAEAGDRVRIVGLPSRGRRLQREITGAVRSSAATRIEVSLDEPADLRGWGGAPVLAADGGVLGMLQAAWPDGQRLKLGVGPIGGVTRALGRPLEGGIGRLFASLAPPPSAATSHGVRRREATGSAFGDLDPRDNAALVVAAATGDAAEAPLQEPRSLLLEIEHPGVDTVVGDAGSVYLAGRALALRGRRRRFDLMIVLDTSTSTSLPSGVDVDGDGRVGQRVRVGDVSDPASSDPDDSILAAEVAAARRLLTSLDPRSTRVGVIRFSGRPPDTRDRLLGRPKVRRAAITEEPLTSDFERLRKALGRLAEDPPRGMTHMAAGIDQATLELLGLEGSISRSDPASEKIILFFTDGTPTLPVPGSESSNVRAVLLAARRARAAGVRIHSFAIGPEALAGPISAVEMAEITEGLFTPVRDPGQLVRTVEQVSFAHVTGIEVSNLDLEERAYQVRVYADGSWDALAPLRSGPNRLEVRARSSEGDEATELVTVYQQPGAPDPPVPAELVTRHNQLLETRLASLRRVRFEAERVQAERMRRELVIEIERERAAALTRAAQQRKELDLELDREDESPAP